MGSRPVGFDGLLDFCTVYFFQSKQIGIQRLVSQPDIEGRYSRQIRAHLEAGYKERSNFELAMLHWRQTRTTTGNLPTAYTFGNCRRIGDWPTSDNWLIARSVRKSWTDNLLFTKRDSYEERRHVPARGRNSMA